MEFDFILDSNLNPWLFHIDPCPDFMNSTYHNNEKFLDMQKMILEDVMKNIALKILKGFNYSDIENKGNQSIL